MLLKLFFNRGPRCDPPSTKCPLEVDRTRVWRFAMCPLLCLFTGALPRRRFWSSMRRSVSAIIALRLTQLGFEVLLAENGYQALAMVGDVQKPIRMPKLSGPAIGRAAGLPRASRTTAHRAHLGRW